MFGFKDYNSKYFGIRVMILRKSEKDTDTLPTEMEIDLNEHILVSIK